MKNYIIYQFIKNHTSRYLKQLYIKVYTETYVYGKFIFRYMIKPIFKWKSNKYPLTLQLPITYKCNFDCVMCGMKKLSAKSGFSPEELNEILEDQLYKKITAVGVNGGEPFLLNNLEEYIKVIISALPQLKNIYIISNGYFTDRIIDKMQLIYKECKKKHIHLQLSISIDGVGEIQDIMRGKKGAFEKSSATCYELLKNRESYCDTFEIASTITKRNVYYLAELDAWAKENHFPIAYNIATVHKRVCNDDKILDFSLFTDKYAQMLAAEFLYTKYLETKSEIYYGLYYYVKNGKRISLCHHQKGVVTLTPNGAISYCATHSDELGNALKSSSYKIFYNKKNLEYRRKLHMDNCATCSQYGSSLKKKEYLQMFARERMKEVEIFR